MTKITVLHIASPYAFSMPVPERPLGSIKHADASGTDTTQSTLPVADPNLSATTARDGADHVSLLVNDAEPSVVQGTNPVTSLHDRVLQRYRDEGQLLDEPLTRTDETATGSA